MGKRYSTEEIGQIQALTTEGYTIRKIAETMGRPEAGIRNIRHRKKLKTKTKETLSSLKQDIQQLKQKKTDLRRDISIMQKRRTDLSKALNTEEQALDTKLQTALYKLKDQKPELFHITIEEQIGKIAAELTGTFLKWIVS